MIHFLKKKKAKNKNIEKGSFSEQRRYGLDVFYKKNIAWDYIVYYRQICHTDNVPRANCKFKTS